MMRIILFSIVMIMILIGGHPYASMYAEFSLCTSTVGKVLEVVNDEVFTISVCDTVKSYEEFSYCYNVEEGDIVVFDGNPVKCDVIGFTVTRNDVRCGVICP